MQHRMLGALMALLLSACSVEHTAQENLAMGMDALEKNQHESAILYFKNALQQSPDLAQARLALGRVYADSGDLKQAVPLFETVYEQGALPAAVIPMLADAYYQQQDAAALSRLIDEHLPAPGAGERAESDWQATLALYDVLLLLRDGRVEDASDAFEQLENQPDTNRDAALRLYTQAQLHSRLSPADALMTLEDLLSRHPDYANGYLLQGQLLFTLRDFEQALQYFSTFEDLRPRDASVQFLLAITALQLKDTERAEKHVDILLLNSPSQPLANSLKATIAFEKGQYAVAREHAEKAMGNGLRTPSNKLIAGLSAFHNGQFESAYRYLQGVSSDYSDNEQLQRLLTFLNFKFGYIKAAGDGYLSDEVGSTKDIVFGNLLAYQLAQSGHPGQSLQILQHIKGKGTEGGRPVLVLQPDEVGLVEEAVTASALEHTANFTAKERLMQVLVLLESGDVESASTLAGHWRQEDPSSLDALNVSAYVAHQRGNLAHARQYYDAALSISPDNVPSLLFNAQLALNTGDINAAEVDLKRVLQTSPNHLTAFRLLLKITFKRDNTPDWEHILTISPLDSMSDDHLVALSDAMLKWQAYVELDQLVFARTEQSNWSDMQWMLWLQNRYFLDDKSTFLNHAGEAIARVETVSQALFILSVAERHRDYALMLEMIEQLPPSMLDNDLIKLQKALALVEVGQFEGINPLLNSVSDEVLNSATVWFVKGRMSSHEGDLVQALSYYRAYYEAAPSFHSVSHLADTLLDANRLADAVALAHDYITSHPFDETAHVSLGLKLATTHPADALAILSRDALHWLIWRNAKLSNNIALLFMSQHEYTDALRYSQRALALQPESNQIRINHARVLTVLNKTKEAFDVLDNTPESDEQIELLKRLITRRIAS